jgi:hypothetical protein
MQDPELKALTAITEALSNLDEVQRRNVLLYVNVRYGIQLARQPGSPDVDSAVTNPSQFSNIGDFFDAADPQTEAERVLVGGYWVQVVEGADDFESMQVNRHLKNLGHPVSNITRALDSMMSQNPRMVIQTQKSGTSKQARKRYKVTREGIKRVQAMLTDLAGDDHKE